MEIKRVKFNMEMSPRGIDELRSIFSDKKCSKYELPFFVIPEDRYFDACIDTLDNGVAIGIVCDDIPVLLKGKLEGNYFRCRSISSSTIRGGRNITAVFSHKSNEDFFRINSKLKKRLDMWYGYIDVMLKKARDSTLLFTYEETVGRNEEMLYIRISGAVESAEVKNLNAGIADDRREPSFSFGKAERLQRGILTVRTADGTVPEMTEGHTKIAIYDAAALITCKRMKSGLDKLCRGEAVNRRLTDFMFDPSAANSEMGDNITLLTEDLLMKNMNSEQIRAVEGVLNARDLYLIQGPPGTGKTTVIAEICYQNAVRGLKTLVVSQSNLAVDNAISRVMNHPEIRVLRKGDTSRVEDEGLPFVEDNVVHTWISSISESAAEMAQNISLKLDTLKKYRNKLPEILRYAEDIRDNYKNKSVIESQYFFCKNVLEEADAKRENFLKLINEAYDNEASEKAYLAREFYPSDFQIPNGIYNDISEKFADIETDVEKIRELENELVMLGKYTAMFSGQMRAINRHVSQNCLDNVAYEGVFHYIDSNLADNLFTEGEKIISSIPYGLKALIFRRKWELAAAIHYRRAESFIYGIQRRTLKISEKISRISSDEEFVQNLETFRFSLDALCQDYDAQYYTIKSKYNSMLEKLENARKDYEYSVVLFREKISDKFFSAALEPLEDVEASIPNLYEIERLVNEYYGKKTDRYLKWQKLLNEWRLAITKKNMNYNSLKQLYINNANVIGITCIQSGTADFEKNYPSFDVVVIDESSKSTPPDIILPMLKGKKIVLVGDHKQLPPYIDSDAYDEIEENNDSLHKSMKMSLFEELYETASSDMKTMLFRQYRMHRDIAALINQFYINTDAGRLESPSQQPKAHCCQGRDVGEDNHVLWYDIKNAPDYYEQKQDKSYCNIYEVGCIKNILGMLNKNLVKNEARKSVGVITFYDAQVKLLEEQLIRNGYAGALSAIDLRTGTVDRFQGMEEDIIIVSFVRNNAYHNIGFAKDSRRINVALSRAKQLLIIIGCSENFIGSENSGASDMFKEIFYIVNKCGGIRNPEDLEKADTLDGTNKKFVKSFVKLSAFEVGSEDHEDAPESLNALDCFIIKAAYEFKDSKVTVRNISGILGIAPVFVKNRAAWLAEQGLISCSGGIIKILRDGEKTAENF